MVTKILQFYRDMPHEGELLYLSSPYTHKDHNVEKWRHKAVLAATAELTLQGIVVFSPIVHSHPIAAMISPEENTYELWLPLDEIFMNRSDKLGVLLLPGVFQSRGVKYEFEAMIHKYKKSVRWFRPEDLGVYDKVGLPPNSWMKGDKKTCENVSTKMAESFITSTTKPTMQRMKSIEKDMKEPLDSVMTIQSTADKSRHKKTVLCAGESGEIDNSQGRKICNIPGDCINCPPECAAHYGCNKEVLLAGVNFK